MAGEYESLLDRIPQPWAMVFAIIAAILALLPRILKIYNSIKESRINAEKNKLELLRMSYELEEVKNDNSINDNDRKDILDKIHKNILESSQNLVSEKRTNFLTNRQDKPEEEPIIWSWLKALSENNKKSAYIILSLIFILLIIVSILSSLVVGVIISSFCDYAFSIDSQGNLSISILWLTSLISMFFTIRIVIKKIGKQYGLLVT